MSTSKSYRKKLRLQAYNQMTVEQKAKNRMAFYTSQSSLPKYQRKLANFGQEWDENLMEDVRQWPEFKKMDRTEAQNSVSSGRDKFVVRPSSYPGYFAVTYIKDGEYVNLLVKYENGQLCSYTNIGTNGVVEKVTVFDSQEEFRQTL